MFVRKRRYTCRKHGSYQASRHQARWDVPYYQVLESVRVDGKPGHRVIASWSGHRSLVAAILAFSDEVRTMQEQLDTCRKALAAHAAGDRLACGRAAPFARKPYEALLKTVPRLERELPPLQAKLDGLRRAHEVLGDWRDDQPPQQQPPASIRASTQSRPRARAAAGSAAGG
jgi:hypothetical protein